MISIVDVHKRFRYHGASSWVLKGVSLCIPRHARLALIGANGAGKSTLLNIVGGMDQPTYGSVERKCRVSWPLGLSGGFQGSLNGRQNARFICRVHGKSETEIEDVLRYVEEFSELGPAMNHPVKTYSSGMRSRLAFAISLVFEFDVYLVDELTSVGDAAFRAKSRRAFNELTDKSGLVMVSHDETTLRNFCQTAVWLHEGKAHYFDSVEEGMREYKQATRT